MENSSLLVFERGAQLLAEANTIQAARELKALALTAAEYAQQMKLGEQAILSAKGYALEAERKMGQMLKEMAEKGERRTEGGDQRSDSAEESGRVTLANINVTPKESFNAQKLASLSEEAFAELKAGKVTRKAATREKSSKSPKPAPRRGEVAALAHEGLSTTEISRTLDIKLRRVSQILREEHLRRDALPDITPDMLSMSARQKLETAIRQHKEKLSAQWHVAIRARVDEILLNTIGPRLRKEQDQARKVMGKRNGIMDRKTYRLIMSCLHPDRIMDEKLKPLYARAFDLFRSVKILLLDEKNDPTEFVGLPTTLAEWDALKRKATLARKRKAGVTNEKSVTKAA